MKIYFTACILALSITMVSSVAIAAKIPLFTIAPTPFFVSIVNDNVTFAWSDSELYIYNVDVDIPQDDYSAHYSLSINRKDPTACTLVNGTYNCSLTVPLSAFEWHNDANPSADQVSIFNASSVGEKDPDRPSKEDFPQHISIGGINTFISVTRVPLKDNGPREHLAGLREF